MGAPSCVEARSFHRNQWRGFGMAYWLLSTFTVLNNVIAQALFRTLAVLNVTILVSLMLCAQALAAGGVYQIGVTRVDGARAAGSAVQISPGKLVASCHTVRAAIQIVVLHPNRQFNATLERADVVHDLCLLRTARFSGSEPTRVHSARLKVGEPVIAFGFAPGFSMSVARGAITALHYYDHGYVIRASTRFPQGASGGGLFDEAGQLLGVLTFRARSEELNYAVPMEWVDRLLEGSSALGDTVPSVAFWEDNFPGQPAFLRAARLEYEENWSALGILAKIWVDSTPDDSEAWVALGRAQVGLRREDEAMVALQRAVALQPTSAIAWYRLALIYHTAGLEPQFADAHARLTLLDSDLARRLREGLATPRN